MRDELDDTVIARPRSTDEVAGPDLEDTVIGSGVDRDRPRARVPSAIAEPTPPRPTRLPTQSDHGIRIGDDGPVISLDVPCYIGRRPRLPRIEKGVTPRLLSVPSPRSEISGTHLEVREVGTAVVVTDLRSTNGTVVRLPGHVPRTLRQGESVVVAPGTSLDLGDDIVVHVVGRDSSWPAATETGGL